MMKKCSNQTLLFINKIALVCAVMIIITTVVMSEDPVLLIVNAIIRLGLIILPVEIATLIVIKKK